MDTREFFESMPYAQHLGVEITHIGDGQAEGQMPVTQTHSWDSDQQIAHGGALFSFADVLGGAAIRSVVDNPTPTIDMRIDYFNAARDDVKGTAVVVKQGSTTATVDVDIIDAESAEIIAEARGVYKVSPP